MFFVKIFTVKEKSGKEIKGKVERDRDKDRDKEIRDLSPQVVQVVWKV